MLWIYPLATGYERGNLFKLGKHVRDAVDFRFSAVLLPCALLGVLFAASACTTGGNPLHGVGAAAPGPEITESIMTDSVTEQATAVPVSAAKTEKTENDLSALQEGTTMNVAVGAKAPELALVAEEIPPAPEMAKTRAEAIEQIREKAANTGKNKPNIFDVKQSSVPRKTTEEQAEVAAEMEALAARNATILSADDAAAKAAEAKKLKLKAKTHYEQALENIEN
jgi:hypothetical protein